MKLLTIIAAMTMCMLPGPAAGQGLKDLFNGLKKAINEKVDEKITEKVENPCIEKEDSAKIDNPDLDKTGTWIVETFEGRRFQVADLAIAGAMEDGTSVATFLSVAQSASFNLVTQDRLTKTYRTHIEYAPAAENNGGVRGLLGAIANNVAQSSMKNDFTFLNLSIGGGCSSFGFAIFWV